MVLSNETKRIYMFLIGCMGARSLLVYLAYKQSTRFYVSVFTILVAIGFMYIYLTGSRQTGGEVFGDKIWWNDLRPIHSGLYALFAFNAIMGNPNAWIYFLIDVVFGLISFLWFHYSNGDFEKVL